MTAIPTIEELFDDILADLMAEFDITLNPLGLAFLTAFAGVFSGFLWLFYLAIGLVQKNVWYDTADSEANGGTLERFGREILGRSPFAAQAGVYTIGVTGTTGGIIPATMVWKSDDSSTSPGMLYQIFGGSYTMPGSSGVVTVVALVGGIGSDLIIGDTLTATAPMANVNPGATVASEVTAPVDAETVEEYRQEIRDKVQLDPGSWSAADYRLVGLDIVGVGQTYAYADSGSSAVVNVYLQGTVDIANPGPSVAPSVITDYTTALDLVLPLGVWDVNYAASTIRNVAVTITMGAFPAFSTAQQSAITTALRAFINSVQPFIASCDNVADRNDTIATYNVSNAITAAVPGYGFSSVTFTVAGSATTNWQADNGEISFFNGVTFV